MSALTLNEPLRRAQALQSPLWRAIAIDVQHRTKGDPREKMKLTVHWRPKPSKLRDLDPNDGHGVLSSRTGIPDTGILDPFAASVLEMLINGGKNASA